MSCLAWEEQSWLSTSTQRAKKVKVYEERRNLNRYCDMRDGRPDAGVAPPAAELPAEGLVDDGGGGSPMGKSCSVGTHSRRADSNRGIFVVRFVKTFFLAFSHFKNVKLRLGE